MSPALRVHAPGLLTTVQDLGRPGLQHLGVPVGGALDPVSLTAANALVGNAPNTAGLEVAYLGPTLTAEADAVRLAVVGASATSSSCPMPAPKPAGGWPSTRAFASVAANASASGR
jgi:allophanate hydrolase subunit 2